jgi:hypothetical protein
MPLDYRGSQLISFAIELDSDSPTPGWFQYTTREGDTYMNIASRRGHPELASVISDKNHGGKEKHPRGSRVKLGKMVAAHYITVAGGRRVFIARTYAPAHLLLPRSLQPGKSFDVLADDPAPLVKSGYATYDIIGRPGRVGVSRFLGYNPVAMDIPVQFEEYIAKDAAEAQKMGEQIEGKIQLLEAMAGRGVGQDAAGPPPVIRISTTGSTGVVHPLIPPNYQWSSANTHAPCYRISNITWDPNPLRTPSGHRVRQKAVIEVTQYTPIQIATRSVATRAKAKKPAPKKKK